MSGWFSVRFSGRLAQSVSAIGVFAAAVTIGLALALSACGQSGPKQEIPSGLKPQYSICSGVKNHSIGLAVTVTKDQAYKITLNGAVSDFCPGANAATDVEVYKGPNYIYIFAHVEKGSELSRRYFNDDPFASLIDDQIAVQVDACDGTAVMPQTMLTLRAVVYGAIDGDCQTIIHNGEYP